MSKYVVRTSDFLDEMNEGLITIDREGTVTTYNAKAKDMLGASRNCKRTHSEGYLEKGDIVIMAFSSFGQDAGGITQKDLKLLGIDLLYIEKGTTLLAIGQYNTGVQGKIKMNGPNNMLESIELNDEFLDVHFTSKIDFVDRFVEISIHQEEFRYYFNNYFNHLVILDGVTKEVKFYQMGGYTIWKEDLKDLIAGNPFHKKLMGYNELEVLDLKLTDLHEKEEIITDILDCAKGYQTGYKRKSGTINGINVISTLKPIKRHGETIGACLLLSDITRLQVTENQRNIAYRKLQKATEALEDVRTYGEKFQAIIGSSQKIMDVKKLAYKASKFKSTVLILGESGTGKSVLAKAIHQVSELKDAPFIEVNLNSIPESLIESELFGYEKGAFTGANTKGKKGYFELANQGTIFLDEIGDLPKAMQVKLLHVIQNRAFYRVGGDKEINVDVRIIVATNKNLEEEVKNNLFREDLYYRINVFPIKQPPLRERIGDIHELVAYILPKICYKIGTDQKAVSAEALEKMTMYHWPGNIRELENVLERAVTLCDGKNLLSEHIQIKVTQKNLFNDSIILKPLKETVKEIELDIIQRVLKLTDGDKTLAMDILKIKKTKLYDSIKEMKTREFPN